jgi:hydrogenase nickel incorporation protein HypA/HybF
MHELSISAAICDTAVRHAAGRRVTGVAVRVGRLRQVVPASLSFCFGLVAKDTVCDGAVLDLELVPARLRCRACGHDWEIDVPAFRCPRCASGDAVVVTGEELEVESIEVEEKEPECIA